MLQRVRKSFHIFIDLTITGFEHHDIFDPVPIAEVPEYTSNPHYQLRDCVIAWKGYIFIAQENLLKRIDRHTKDTRVIFNSWHHYTVQPIEPMPVAPPRSIPTGLTTTTTTTTASPILTATAQPSSLSPPFYSFPKASCKCAHCNSNSSVEEIPAIAWNGWQVASFKIFLDRYLVIGGRGAELVVMDIKHNWAVTMAIRLRGLMNNSMELQKVRDEYRVIICNNHPEYTIQGMYPIIHPPVILLISSAVFTFPDFKKIAIHAMDTLINAVGISPNGKWMVSCIKPTKDLYKR